MPPSLQAKLLRVLQTCEFTPLGSSESRKVTVRVVAATNKNLLELVAKGSFREDLFYRLDVIDFTLPPLRERKGDLPLLIRYFLKKYKAEKLRLTREVENRLLAYNYPGNIRELENIIHRATVLAEDQHLEIHHFPASLRLPNNRNHAATITEIKHLAAENAERDFAMDCMRNAGGHLSKATRIAGIDVSNFHKIVKKHRIDLNGFKAG